MDLNPFNKLALVGIIACQILFFFNSDKDRLRCVFTSNPALSSSSIVVGDEREGNLIRNDPDKSEFTIKRIC